MPMHVAAFRVRHYECDAYGHLNNLSYVRYLHEAALEADAPADPGAALSAESLWQTRRLDIEYLQPVRYGDTVTVGLSAATVAGTAMRRSYELRLHGSGELVAQAQIEASLVEAASLKPPTATSAPPEEPGSDLPHRLDPLPPLPAPPAGAFRMSRRVTWQDLDMAQRVSDVTMLGFTEMCGMGVIAAHGWPPERMAAEGFAIILRRHQAEYSAQAALGDELVVATWASGVKRASATRHYTITRACDGMLLARVDTLGVWVSLETGRPMRIPPHFMADFAPNLV